MRQIAAQARVRAPELSGTSGPTLASLRGRFVLLHFWSSSCANCLHVLDELRPFEAHRRDVLTIIGVHSPKFTHETAPQAVATAVARYGITHPVISDPDLHLWRQYAVKAWPTLVLVDPDGYIVAQAAGEGHVSAIDELLDELVPLYARRGTLQPGRLEPLPPERETYAPAGAVLLPADRTGRAADTLLVADTGGHVLVELTLDGRTVLRTIGAGRGAPFTAPAGLTVLPAGLTDYDVLVADTGAHVLRGVRLGDGAVLDTIDLPARLAGARTVTGPVPGVPSPWDVAWWPAAGRVVIAAAGVHLLLSLDLGSGSVEVLAGTTVEGLRDGPALDGWLAQPSGLAVDGERIWFVDAETSALRYLTCGGELHTAIGEGLFDFGLVDGTLETGRLQHPLGVALLPGGALAVADTFNGAVRYFDPSSGVLSTLAAGLAEPASIVVLGDELAVIEAAAGRVSRVPLPRPVVLQPGRVELIAAVDVPAGHVPDDRDGPATRLEITASPPSVLAWGSGVGTEPTRTIQLAGPGLLHVTAQLASCDDVTAPHPACHLTRIERVHAVSLDPSGADFLRIDG